MDHKQGNADGSKPESNDNGVYVRGVVISNSARVFEKKDNRIRHELAVQPGVVIYERLVDPTEEPSIKIKDREVTEFPKLKEFQTVTIKASRYSYFNNQLSVSGEIVA